MRIGALKIICASYLLLLVYASCMPFDLTAAPADAWRHFSDSLRCWPFVPHQHASKADILSNLLLYVPAGFLLAACWSAKCPRRLAVFLASTGLCIAVSASVESVQAFSQSRITSAQDLLMNSIGGAVGALAGCICGRACFIRCRRMIRLRSGQQAASLVGPLLLILLAGDAFYPFLPTLDVSQVWSNVKSSILSLDTALALHPWHYWLVKRVGVYAFLAAFLAMAYSAKPRYLCGALWAILFSAALELGKLLIESRSANLANVAMSACGALTGAGIAATIHRPSLRRINLALIVALLAAYVCYLELEPFQFAWDVSSMARKLPSGAGYLPLNDYAHSGGMNDVRLFARSILLLAGLVFAVMHATPFLQGRSLRWKIIIGLTGAGLLGLLLEMAQFLLPTRTPSVSDVFSFAVGGALGAYTSNLRPGRNDACGAGVRPADPDAMEARCGSRRKPPAFGRGLR